MTRKERKAKKAVTRAARQRRNARVKALTAEQHVATVAKAVKSGEDVTVGAVVPESVELFQKEEIIACEMPLIITFPKKRSCDNPHGLMNVQVFGATGNLPRFVGNTEMAASHLHRIAGGGRRMHECQAVYGDEHGVHMVASYVGKKSDCTDIVTEALSSLPKKELKFLLKHVPACTAFACDSHQKIGIV